jgi:hypothetical protein
MLSPEIEDRDEVEVELRDSNRFYRNTQRHDFRPLEDKKYIPNLKNVYQCGIVNVGHY